MSPRSQIAHYRLRRNAAKYAAELATKYPDWDWKPVQHPRDFGWAVGQFSRKVSGIQSFAGRRPKGGFANASH